MARVEAVATLEVRQWSLDFVKGWRRSLRVGGFFAGYPSKEELFLGIQKQQEREERHRRERPDERVLPVNNIEEPESTSDGVGARSNEHGRRFDGMRSPVAVPMDTSFRARQSTTSRLNGGRRRNFRVEEDEIEDVDQEDQEEQASAEQPANYEGEGEDPIILTEVEEAETSLKPATEGHEIEPSTEGEEYTLEVNDFVITTHDSDGNCTNFPFMLLPMMINRDMKGGEECAEHLYLDGILEHERERRTKKVVMWKLLFPLHDQPTFLVMTRRGNWIKLCEPNRSYQRIMNSARAAAGFLHYMNKRPDTSKEIAKIEMAKSCSPSGQRSLQHCFIGEEDSFDTNGELRGWFHGDDDLLLDRLYRSELTHTILSTYVSSISRRACGLFPRQVVPVIGSMFPKMFKEIALSLRDDYYAEETDGLTNRTDNGGESKKRKKLTDDGGESATRRKRAIIASRSDDPLRHSPLPSEDALQRRREDKHHVKRKSRDTGRQSRVTREDSPAIVASENEENGGPYSEDPPICNLCDDGGSVLFCEGPCRRHFHPSRDSGINSFCDGLGMTDLEVERTEVFYCPNCQHEQQQCFLCGELGSSVATSSGFREVHCCDLPFCDRFYHLECIARVYFPLYGNVAEIRNGTEKFYCPRHSCVVCGKPEIEAPGRLVQCRRCPRGWHKECLQNYKLSRENRLTPIWNQYDRQYIYCRRHPILPVLQTPERGHIKFPRV